MKRVFLICFFICNANVFCHQDNFENLSLTQKFKLFWKKITSNLPKDLDQSNEKQIKSVVLEKPDFLFFPVVLTPLVIGVDPKKEKFPFLIDKKLKERKFVYGQWKHDNKGFYQEKSLPKFNKNKAESLWKLWHDIFNNMGKRGDLVQDFFALQNKANLLMTSRFFYVYPRAYKNHSFEFREVLQARENFLNFLDDLQKKAIPQKPLREDTKLLNLLNKIRKLYLDDYPQELNPNPLVYRRQK